MNNNDDFFVTYIRNEALDGWNTVEFNCIPTGSDGRLGRRLQRWNRPKVNSTWDSCAAEAMAIYHDQQRTCPWESLPNPTSMKKMLSLLILSLVQCNEVVIMRLEGWWAESTLNNNWELERCTPGALLNASTDGRLGPRADWSARTKGMNCLRPSMISFR